MIRSGKRTRSRQRGRMFLLALATLLLLPMTLSKAQQSPDKQQPPSVSALPNGGSAQLQVSLAFLFFGLQDDTLVVRKRYRVENPTPVAIEPAREAVRIDLPPSLAEQATIKVSADETTTVIPTFPSDDGRGYQLDTPMQPGQSLIDVGYRTHFHAGGQPYEERFFHPVGTFYVYTYPLSLAAGSSQLLSATSAAIGYR